MITLNRFIKRNPIGQRVRIKKGLIPNSYVDDVFINPMMIKHCGKSTTIVDHDNDMNGNYYNLKIDPEWYWSKEMLELIK